SNCVNNCPRQGLQLEKVPNCRPRGGRDWLRGLSMSGTTRTILLHYGGALVLTALAVVLRWLLDPLLGAPFPLITLFGVVVFVAWYAGRGPALLSLLVGAVAGDYFFFPPRYSFTIGRSEDQTGLALYGLLGIASIGLFESLRNARRRAQEKE